MAETRRIDQLYVCIYRPSHASESAPDPAMMARHRAYLDDLLARKLLMGSGATRDETGTRHGAGIVILRTPTLAAAQEIAAQEPFTVAGERSVEVLPWQRSSFGD
jgi:uncharacterized protein YciI